MDGLNKAKVEIYSHWLLCSYLDGDIKKAKACLLSLRRIQQVSPHSFDYMTHLQVKRFKDIAYALDNNVMIKQYSNLNDSNNSEEVKTGTGLLKEEKELVKQILGHEAVLKNVLRLQKLRIVGIEHNTSYGRVDIFGRTRRLAVPIEVKAGKATAQVVSQIDKYIKHFLKMLHYNLWVDVQGVVIAGGYDQYVMAELNKLNVVKLVYSYLGGQLILNRV